jgi:signal transduction histidine kinase
MNASTDRQPQPTAQTTASSAELTRLQQLNNWYEKALRFSNIGLYRWESANDKWFWSDKVFELRGFPRDERYVAPEPFYARVHQDDRALLLAAQSAHRAKNMFVANVSHELRTPLNGIMGLTDIAMKKSDDSKVQDCLGKARVSSRRLLSLISDLIDIADIEAERVVLEHQPFTLTDICQKVDRVIRPTADRKGLAFHIDIAPALATRTLAGDAPRLTQVVLNLADNAVKFTAQGRVDIRFDIERETADALTLRCDVEDTGIGIPGAEQARLFSLFEQGDGSSTRRNGGVGLGLALSQKLAHLMNGGIVVNSRPGAGSTSRFTSPLAVA